MSQHVELYTKGPKQLFTGRGGDYRNKNGSQGYTGPNHQVHHVLPCGSLTKSTDEFIEGLDEPGPARLAIERITVFDVNAKTNLLGLPTAPVYAQKFGTPFSITPKKPKPINVANPKVASCNLPVHLWNHPQYSKEAKTRADKVWNNVNLKIEKHKPVSASDVGQDLQNISDYYRGKVTAPTRKRTKEAWRGGKKSAFDII